MILLFTVQGRGISKRQNSTTETYSLKVRGTMKYELLPHMRDPLEEKTENLRRQNEYVFKLVSHCVFPCLSSASVQVRAPHNDLQVILISSCQS